MMNIFSIVRAVSSVFFFSYTFVAFELAYSTIKPVHMWATSPSSPLFLVFLFAYARSGIRLADLCAC